MTSIFQKPKPRTAAHLSEDQTPLWEQINLLASAALLIFAVELLFSLLAIYPVESAVFVNTGLNLEE